MNRNVLTFAITGLTLSFATLAGQPKPSPNDPPKPAFGGGATIGGGGSATDDGSDIGGQYNVDEVVCELAVALVKDRSSAQDAIIKIGGFGKRSISVMDALFQSNFNAKKEGAGRFVPEPRVALAAAKVLARLKTPEAVRALRKLSGVTGGENGKDGPDKELLEGAVLALCRIKNGEAGRILVPLLTSPDAPVELRLAAVQASGLEYCDEGADTLRKLAADKTPSLRLAALRQLSYMPAQWAKSEELFVAALDDADAETREQAAKTCYFSRIFTSAAPKLTRIAENDPADGPRVQAMLALGRMKIRGAVAAIVRVALNEGTRAPLRLQAVRTVNQIAGTSIKDAVALKAWWEKSGSAEFAKLELPPENPAQPVVPAIPATPSTLTTPAAPPGNATATPLAPVEVPKPASEQ